jgi:hypothetical protein
VEGAEAGSAWCRHRKQRLNHDAYGVPSGAALHCKWRIRESLVSRNCRVLLGRVDMSSHFQADT